MSRFSDTVEEVLEEIGAPGRAGGRVAGRAHRAASSAVGHGARRVDVEIRAHFPLTRRAPLSGKPSQELYTLIGRAVATARARVRLVGVEAEGMMACPCAQDMVRTHAPRAADRGRHRRRAGRPGPRAGPDRHPQPARARPADGRHRPAAARGGPGGDRGDLDELRELRPAQAARRAVRGGEGAPTPALRRGRGARDAAAASWRCTPTCPTTPTCTRGR